MRNDSMASLESKNSKASRSKTKNKAKKSIEKHKKASNNTI